MQTICLCHFITEPSPEKIIHVRMIDAGVETSEVKETLLAFTYKDDDEKNPFFAESRKYKITIEAVEEADES